MTIRKPSIFFRALVLGAQGVFYNAFCACYRDARPTPYIDMIHQSFPIFSLRAFATASLATWRKKQ